MEPNSFEDDQESTNILEHEASLNQTANSIHYQGTGQRDKEMSALNPILVRFIREQLEVRIKFTNFQLSDIFSEYKKEVIKPCPKIYCLPHTILLTAKNKDLSKIHDQLEDRDIPNTTSRYDQEKRQINVRVHDSSELVFYNIRCLKADAKLHQDPRMLDSRFLVDKLVQFYEHFYHRIYFKQTMALMLYWAHQKQLLEHVIPQQALKLLIICNFINFGYGVENVVSVQSNKPEKIRQFKKMNTYCRHNHQTGEAHISPDLIQQYRNYTVQEKRGFYMTNINKFMQIKDIIPVSFPVLPLSSQEEDHLERQIGSSLRSVVGYQRESMSICKNIAKIITFWQNKLQKDMKLVIDFSENTAYRHEYAEGHELEVIHPVLGTSICKIKDSPMKNFKAEVIQLFDNFNQNMDVIDVVKKMFQKSRL